MEWIGKKKQTNVKIKWSNVYRIKNLCSKQSENLRTDPIEKSWTSRYRISKITKDAQVSQEELFLLVAKNTEWYQKVCSRILEVSTEQDAIYEKSRTSSTGNTSKTITGN